MDQATVAASMSRSCFLRRWHPQIQDWRTLTRCCSLPFDAACAWCGVQLLGKIAYRPLHAFGAVGVTLIVG